MYKSYSPSRETWALPAALAVLISSLWLPTARADVFVSGSNTLRTDVLSFSQVTAAPKLDMPVGRETTGLAIGPDGNLYVADETPAVVRFNPAGVLIGTFIPAGSGLSFPLGMTFGPDGNLYVADYSTGVHQFNGTTGASMAVITTGEPGVGLYPFDVRFGPDNNLYVSDDNSNTILRYNGSTLAFMNTFAVPPLPSSTGTNAPYGMAFGHNGNLYAICGVTGIDGSAITVNFIFEFDATTGAYIPFSGIGSPETYGSDLAVGPDGFIYVPEGTVINRYNPSGGYLQNAFSTDSKIGAEFITFGFLSPPDALVHTPFSLITLQTLRLTVVEGPVTVAPGVPVEATLGFANAQGVSVGPTSTVSLTPGQTASLDLDASTLIASGQTEVRPVVTAPVGTPAVGGTLESSAEVFETSTGFGSVFGRGAHSIHAAPKFVPQGVAYGQTMRITALAPPDSSCNALLSFADNNGNPLGTTSSVNLSPGQMAALSFNANSITGQLGQRIEVQPTITLQNATGSGGAAPACEGSVEVYDQLSGRTATRQDSGGSF